MIKSMVGGDKQGDGARVIPGLDSAKFHVSATIFDSLQPR